MEQEAKAPVWPFWIYGLIIGGAGIIFTLLFYLSGIVVKTWTSYVTGLAMFGTLIGMLFMYRSEHLGGFAHYAQYIWVSLLSVLVAAMVSAIFWFMLITVFDDTLLDQMQQYSIEQSVKVMEKMEKIVGEIPQDDFDKAIEDAIDKAENGKMLNVPWINAIMSFVTTFFMLLPLSFLAPVFARRKRPEGGIFTNELE